MCLGAIYWAGLDRIYYALSRADAASFGFDDTHLYDEISKQHGDRKLPIERIALLQEALDVFQEWKNKKDKFQD